MAAYNTKKQIIDITSIISKIRTNVRKKGFTIEKLSFKDNFEDVFLSLIPKNNIIFIEEQLDILRNSWEIQPNKLLIGNILVVFIRKIIRKLIKFYIMPIVSEQNVFNRSILNILEKNFELKFKIEDLCDRVEQMKRKIKKFPVNYNEELLFIKDSFAVNYLDGGFSDPEDTLTWTNQETALINIPISNTKTDIKITIKGQRLTPLQTVEVEVNNRVYGTLDNYISDFFIKADELMEYNYLNIKFNISRPYTPKELGISEDVRTLGFSLMAISLNVETNKEVFVNG